MAYREVTVLEVREVLRQWLSGVAKARIALNTGADRKTVRRYVTAAEAAGLAVEHGPGALTDELAERILKSLRGQREREHGDSWARCEEQRAFIEKLLKQDVRLTKVHRLLRRNGVEVPYSTLHRFAVEALAFGRKAATVPVIDGKPGEELQVDVGWVVTLTPDASGRRRKVRAWIFTPNVSRYRFVYPCDDETTASAIEACEAAWDFYGGVFRVLVPDNTKAIIQEAKALGGTVTRAFLDYAQARGFHIDAARVRRPKDKGRVEKSVRDVRDDCFAGEVLRDVEQARAHGRRWCAEEYGLRQHSTTLRMPKEHFETIELPALLTPPAARYDTPIWAEPKVARDHFASVAKSLYSLPTHLIGRTLTARADSILVRFYDGLELVKTHPRKRPGERSIDPSDFPKHKTPYAMRDIDFLAKQAAEHGEAVGEYARRLLDGPLPWARMRRVRALLNLCRKYGDARVDETSRLALAADMVDVERLGRMLELATKPAAPPPPAAQVIPLARYLRPPSQYALPLASRERDNEGEKR